MFGIRDGDRILCWHTGIETVSLKQGDRIRNPVMVKDSHTIDQLHQEVMVAMNRYSLAVFKFTKEQEAEFIISKLKGD